MNFKEQLIIKFASVLNINILGTAYKSRGIGLPNDFRKNGEQYFIKNILDRLLRKKNDLIFFDVGQNKGDYTQALIDFYPNANIHGFEPNHHLSDKLADRFKNHPNVYLNNFGLGTKREKLSLFITKMDNTTGHGSIFKQVMTDLHNNQSNVEEIEIDLNTLSNYCKEQNISYIDFLKIDVEGNELSVLQGAGNLIDQIKIIQFEFNEMNIISRCFLKDFYDLMPNFDFYRQLPNGLFPLGLYSSKHESFIIQNLVAIQKKMVKQKI